MSSIIEMNTIRLESERAEKLNLLELEETRRSREQTQTMLDKFAKKQQAHEQDFTKAKMETELHKAEMNIRAKYENSSTLPPAAHPEDVVEVRRRRTMRDFLSQLAQKD